MVLPIKRTCKLLGLRVVKVLAAELDSRMLSNGGLAHQRSCELGILRRGNPCIRGGAPSRGGTHNGENSQAGVCVSRLVKGNYQGYKLLRGASSTAFVFRVW